MGISDRNSVDEERSRFERQLFLDCVWEFRGKELGPALALSERARSRVKRAVKEAPAILGMLDIDENALAAWAARSSEVELARWLVDKGALWRGPCFEKGESGGIEGQRSSISAAYLAAAEGSFEMAAFFGSLHGERLCCPAADPESSHWSDGCLPMMVAARYANFEALRGLRSIGHGLSRLNSGGENALHGLAVHKWSRIEKAALWIAKEAPSLLLERNASDGDTPAEAARRCGSDSAAPLLALAEAAELGAGIGKGGARSTWRPAL